MVHRSSIRIARDYNRGLPWWIRWCHIAWAATASPLIRGLGWCFAAERRFWAGSLLVAVVLLPIVIPRDAVIGAFLVDAFSGVGGDIRREIKAWQQFGGVTSVAVFAAAVLLLDRARAGRLADVALAMGLTAAATTALKILIGRPRPKFADPSIFLWPGGVYPVERDGQVLLLGAASPLGRAELWSMPSSHTSAAVALCVGMSAMYPRVRWLAAGLVGVVIVGRTMADAVPAHWPSDVIAGGCLGWLVAGWVVRESLGSRLLGAVGGLIDGRRRGGSSPAGLGEERGVDGGGPSSADGALAGKTSGVGPFTDDAPCERDRQPRMKASTGAS